MGPAEQNPALGTELEPVEGETGPCLCGFSQPQGKSRGWLGREACIVFFHPHPCLYSGEKLVVFGLKLAWV